MLFSGEEVLKPVNVLSGGEKVRVMLSKLMLSKANVLVLDDPTNHLDLESITALNDGLMAFTGSILFASHDHQFIQTLANRIIAVSDKGVIDRAETTYDEFLENPEIQNKWTFYSVQIIKNEVGTEAFNSENQVGTVQHLFTLQIVFLSNKKEFPKIVIKHNEERVDVA